MKYSIIIPTRNGASYVVSAINSILQQDYTSCEVVVSVNHSSDDTLLRLARLSDPRLRVIVPPKPLSMNAHYEWCLGQVSGEWVTILGDDDAVMPYFFNELDALLDKHNESSVLAVSTRRAYYFWPGCEELYGSTAVVYHANRESRNISSIEIFISAFFTKSEYYDFPMLYTSGIIRRSLVEDIKKKSGDIFYHELAPDVYSGVAIAIAAKKFLRSEMPLFWTGTSPKSVGLSTNFLNNMKPASQDKNNLNGDRANEFLSMATEDIGGVANVVGKELWLASRSTPMYILSSMYKVPFMSIYWRLIRPFFLCSAFLIEKKKLSQMAAGQSRDQLKLAFDMQMKRTKILYLILFFINIIWQIINKIKRIIRKFESPKRLEKKEALVAFNSDNHLQFPDIESANAKILSIYQSGQLS